MRPGTDSHSGAVQAHGALLAVDARSWRVTHASANLAAFIGIDAALALGQPLTALLGADATESLRDAIRTRRPGSIGLSLGTAQPPGAENVRLLPFVSSDSAIEIDLIHEDRGNTAEATLIRTRRIVQALRLSRTTIGLSHIHAIRSLDVRVAVDDSASDSPHSPRCVGCPPISPNPIDPSCPNWTRSRPRIARSSPRSWHLRIGLVSLSLWRAWEPEPNWTRWWRPALTAFRAISSGGRCKAKRPWRLCARARRSVAGGV
jgi:hypothetical protein